MIHLTPSPSTPDRLTLPLEGGKDARGELRVAATLDELDQRVKVITFVVRQSGRERLCEAAVCKLLAPPADDVGAGCLTCLCPHVSIGVPRGAILTCRKFNRSASESVHRSPGPIKPQKAPRGVRMRPRATRT
jgi:hypothetical protein